MEIVDVREIDVLSHLSEEEVEDIKYVHVYGSGRPRGGLSALYITRTDQVYLAGFGSLFGIPNSPVESGDGLLAKSYKVDELSGLGVVRIVVCAEFGAALTVDNNLYLWGRDVGGEVIKVFKVAIQCHYDGVSCPNCSRELSATWGGWLSWCHTCHTIQNAVSPLPHPWVDWPGPVKIGLCHRNSNIQPSVLDVFCTICGKNWVECGIGIELKDLRLMFCKICVAIIDGEWYNFIPSQTNPAPHKVTFEKNLQILTIAAGTNFLLIQTPSQLFIWGEMGGFRHNNILTLDDVAIAKMSCGPSVIALVSFKGDLYIRGNAQDKAGVLPMSIRKVSLKAPAVDVACGINSTVCLLKNGTFEFIGDVSQMISGGVRTTELGLVSIMTVANQKIIESTMRHYLQRDRKPAVLLTGDCSDAYLYLHSLDDENLTKENNHLWTDISTQTEVDSMDKETSTFCWVKSSSTQTEVDNMDKETSTSYWGNSSSTQTELDSTDKETSTSGLGSARSSYTQTELNSMDKETSTSDLGKSPFTQTQLSGMNKETSTSDLVNNPSTKTELDSMDKETSTSDLGNSPFTFSSTENELFGKTLLSDLTLKLSDGTIPVHRIILYNTSVYFRELFTDLGDMSSPGVMDMSSYNTTAYRSLLKYFYRVPVGDLSCEDLFDLYVLASSYNEDWVVRDVFTRLKNSISHSNVLSLHDRAEAANATDLLEQCKIFMDTPSFRISALQRMMQNEQTMVAVLRAFSNTSLRRRNVQPAEEKVWLIKNIHPIKVGTKRSYQLPTTTAYTSLAK